MRLNHRVRILLNAEIGYIIIGSHIYTIYYILFKIEQFC